MNTSVLDKLVKEAPKTSLLERLQLGDCPAGASIRQEVPYVSVERKGPIADAARVEKDGFLVSTQDVVFSRPSTPGRVADRVPWMS